MKAVTYTIKDDIKGLACFIKTIISYIQSVQTISEDTLFEIKVILNELIINAICHGNNCDDNKTAIVTVKILKIEKGVYLYIGVKDEGEGLKQDIDLKKLSDYVECKNNTLNEHGRGLLIVEKLSDQLKFSRCGSRVAVLKKLTND